MGYYCADHGHYDYCPECFKDSQITRLRAELEAERKSKAALAAAVAEDNA